MFNNIKPYTLRKEIIAGVTHYYVSFEDGIGEQQESEVSLAIYLEFLCFVKQERNLRRWNERYIEQSILTHETLYTRTLNAQKSVDDTVCDKLRDEQVRQAVAELPNPQRRRLYWHHALGLSVPQIAEMEACSERAIKYSISIAKEKLKKKFKK